MVVISKLDQGFISIKWKDRAIPCGGGHVPMDSLCGEDKIHIEIRRCVKG
jgi:hypothetical protein